ncbi:MAG: YkgJ family cysteine cluster protein [Planctomycetota bacterium]|nr:YkgJ family cysteine cluster protein [Planctomycetota bacterium]
MTEKNNNKSDHDRPSNLPWYEDGLRFECAGCGGCCIGDPGYVWVNKEEIAALAELLEMTAAGFRRKYVRKEHGRRSLRELENGDCVFFDRKTMGCTVYEARPLQCRTWPFWQSNLHSPGTWEYTRGECPGAGTGPVVSFEEIELQRTQKRV